MCGFNFLLFDGLCQSCLHVDLLERSEICLNLSIFVLKD